MGSRVPLFVLAGVLWVSPALGQMPTFDWVQIGNPGNAPYTGTPGNASDAANNGLIGHGSVDYTYYIARTELTHTQYLPFLNMLATHPNHPVYAQLSGVWGLGTGPDLLGMIEDEAYSGPGRQYRLNGQSAGQWPIFGLSWRFAALYVNWLNNGAQDDPWTITSGAYDVSTFNNSTDWTDQPAHSPGALYWIPTLDEWIKAAHYDPNRYGTGQGGYWLYPTGRDTAPLSGLPQNGGQFNAGNGSGYPVGMYPGYASPWGVLDMAGGVREWTETIRDMPEVGLPRGRYADGSDNESQFFMNRIDVIGAPYPFTDSHGFGLRIASSIPAPSTGVVLLIFAGVLGRRKRSHQHP